MASGDIRIGISGWTYGRWRGVFYPEKLPRKRELGFAARCFPSIEINGTFYRLLQPDSFARWRDETPPGFVFAVKGSRYITHMRRLKDIETALANFMASGVLRRSEEHTSELQSLMRISYAVFCLKKKIRCRD